MDLLELEIKPQNNELIIEIKNHGQNEVNINMICISIKETLPVNKDNDIFQIQPNFNLFPMKKFIFKLNIKEIIQNFSLDTKFSIKIYHSNKLIHESKIFSINSLVNI